MPTSLLVQAAAHSAGAQQYPAATLYVVASPIGNLADLTLRAIHVLGLMDAVACEDTRVSRGLLDHLGLSKPLLALHAHNEHEGAAQVVALLAKGQRVAYLSDAGTPAISDPGAVLVAHVVQHGFRVLPVPGPSSAITALSVAGDASAAGFAFIGFLPAKALAREAALRTALAAPQAQVLFEAPHRIAALAAALAAQAPQRRVTLCRELTKQFETVATLAAGELPAWLAADANRLRGEFVLVLHAPPVRVQDDALPEDALRCLRVLLRELPLKQAVSLAAELTACPRNRLYEQALAWRDSAPPAP